jgi:hypothetical protein
VRMTLCALQRGLFTTAPSRSVVSMPEKSIHATGSVPPRSGFKRFVEDPKNAPPRLNKYTDLRMSRLAAEQGKSEPILRGPGRMRGCMN